MSPLMGDLGGGRNGNLLIDIDTLVMTLRARHICGGNLGSRFPTNGGGRGSYKYVPCLRKGGISPFRG